MEKIEYTQGELYNLIYFNVLCKAIIHGDVNYYENLYLKNLTDNEILSSFGEYIKEIGRNSFISPEVKENIINICAKLRNINDENRKERISIINDIVLSVNSQVEDKSLDFYADEYAYRFNMQGKTVYDTEIYEVKNVIVESIILDPSILKLQSKEYTEEEFEKYIDALADKPEYLLSLNYLIVVYPEITVNELFLNRTIKVLNRAIENSQTKKQANWRKKCLNNVQKIKKKIQ